MSKKYSEISDLSFYDYPKTIAKYKKTRRGIDTNIQLIDLKSSLIKI